MRISAILAVLLAALTSISRAAPVPDSTALTRVGALLEAYSKKDVPAVLDMLDPAASMYGTAVSEFYTSPSGIRRLLQGDYRQWVTSSFGEPRNVTVETSSELQSVFFDAPFTATYANHRRQTFIIRFATVWHRAGNRWLLVQSMNAVPNGNG